MHTQDNAIRDIKALRNLKDLAVLNLGGTNVQDIFSLSGMQNLSWLCLNGKIADLSPLASLSSLQRLYLNGDNSVINQNTPEIDITPLSGLDKLTTIDRMPVILPDAEKNHWLDLRNPACEVLHYASLDIDYKTA